MARDLEQVMRLILIAVMLLGARVHSQPTSGCIANSMPIGMAVSAGTLYYCSADNTWTAVSSGGGGSLPAGSIVLIASGTCPAGFAEAAALNGKMLRGTLAANGDVGTTGGADTITPTVNALTAAAQTFTGGSVTSGATGAGTPTGTLAWPAGVPTFAGALLATHLHAFGTIAVAAHTVVATKQGTAAGNVVTTATHTVSGSTAAITAGTPSGTVAWPAGVPTFTGDAFGTHTHSVTAAGTNGTSAVTGTLNGFDNRPAYLNVIFCSKT